MTATESLAHECLDQIVTALQAINGGSNYNNDFQTDGGGRVSLTPFGMFPAERTVLVVRYDGEELKDDAIYSTYTITRSKLNFAVECYTQDVESTAHRTILNLIDDVRKRLQITSVRQLGNNASNLYLTEITKPERLDSGYIYAEVRGWVDYHYNSQDPSSKN